MSKKKKQLSKQEQQYTYFSNYAKKANAKQMAGIKDDLEKLLKELEQDEKKFRKQKAKVKGGKVELNVNDYIRKHPKDAKRKAADLFKSTDFIEVLKFLSTHGKAIAIVVAQMIAALIVIVLSSKEIRETLSAKTIKRMQKTYKVCSDLH